MDVALECRPEKQKALFTVGHSNMDFPQLASLLKGAGVELVVDVRSRPQSSRFPQFNQMVLEKLLGAEKIAYLFLGEELGGRPDDPDAYGSDGLVNYRARRKSYAFRAGLERVLVELERRPLALLCAEEDPLECHRFLMICPELVACGASPLHIRKGPRIETQEEAENRLLESNGFADVAGSTLFPQARLDALDRACDAQAERIAFRVSPLSLDQW